MKPATSIFELVVCQSRDTRSLGMAPKSRIHVEDSRAEHLSAKERNGAMHTGSSIRGRRTVQQQAGGDRASSKANAAKENAVASTNVANGNGSIAPSEGSKVLHTPHFTFR